MPMHRLIYASRAGGITRDDLTAILDSSHRNNARAHVTGMLLFDNGHFLQFLEGDRAAVSARFASILQDTRHDDVQILTAGPAETRLFTGWHMHHVVVHGDRAALLRRYMTGPGFQPFDLAPGAAERLCRDYAGLAGRDAA